MISDDDTQQSKGDQGVYAQPIVSVPFASKSNPILLLLEAQVVLRIIRLLQRTFLMARMALVLVLFSCLEYVKL